MQDLTAFHCANSDDGAIASLQDKRDSSTYTIAKINGSCWMTQNLRLSSGRTLTPADSNVDNDWYFPTHSLTSGDSYEQARSIISSNTSYGGYYNFCAASAGSACQRDEKEATQDICPKGWRLPTYDEIYDVYEYRSAFSPVHSGLYDGGSLRSTGSYGGWWGFEVWLDINQCSLEYSGNVLEPGASGKDDGISVRCVLSN